MARGRRDSGGEVARAIQALQDGEVASLYLLHGAETFLRDEFLRVLRAAVLSEGAADFNHDRFDWAQTEASTVLEAALTLPFMVPRRLVEVRAFESVTQADADLLSGLVESPPQTATVVFVAEKADMRKALFQRLSRAGVALRMDPPSGRELPAWLRLQAKGLGIALAPGVEGLLVDMVEPSLTRLRSELGKLADYLGPEGVADEEAVREVVGRSKVEARYKMADAIAAGSAGPALALLRELLDAGEEPYALLGLLRNSIRKWAITKAGVRKRLPTAELASLLGVPPFAVDRYKKQVEKASPVFLRGLYGRLLEADRQIKRSRGGRLDRHALELFVLDLARARNGFFRTG